MTGRGTSKKRHSSQPLGSDAKDARGDANLEATMDSALEDLSTWSQVTARGRGAGNRFSLLTQANSYPDRSMRSASMSSRGSRRGTRAAPENVQRNETDNLQTSEQDLTYSESSLGAASRFVTPQPDGAFRDDFAVEFQQLNGKPFKGTITLKEARDTVFRDILGFNPRLLHSIRPVFGGVTTIRFKLKEQINMDNLASVEFFDLERVINPTRTDIISSRVMGVRGLQAAPNYDGTSNDVRWIKLENCEYAVNQEQMVEWMKLYGQPLSLLGEDMYPDSEDSEAGPLGNGTYSIKMKLERDIPQFLPMHGRKIRVYFKNMTKLCSNCYGCHTRRQCTNEKVPWITYVRDFMVKNPDITEDFYGKWWEVVDKEYPGYFDTDHAEDEQESRNEAPNQAELSQTNQTAGPSSQAVKKPPVPPPPRQLHQRRQSRDPRLNKRQSEQDVELSLLMNRGLSFIDATNYLKNKREQAYLESRMQDQQNVRTLPTRTGPGPSTGGRGGLSFN